MNHFPENSDLQLDSMERLMSVFNNPYIHSNTLINPSNIKLMPLFETTTKKSNVLVRPLNLSFTKPEPKLPSKTQEIIPKPQTPNIKNSDIKILIQPNKNFQKRAQNHRIERSLNYTTKKSNESSLGRTTMKDFYIRDQNNKKVDDNFLQQKTSKISFDKKN